MIYDERSKMISSSREKDFQAKQEGETNDGKVSKGPSGSRQWPGFRNPRIVRMSRSFGGKDRHSKVCTIRGLRDRRIRLSVPTALQLYDLQDRLGLSQPSKVIDWLLDNTKDDIDKLPPLPLPQGFGQFHQAMLVNSHHHEPNPNSQSSLPPFFDANSMFMMKDAGGEDHQSLGAKRYWDYNMDAAAAVLRAKSKEVESESTTVGGIEKGKWIKVNDDDNEQENDQADGNNIGDYTNGVQASSQKLFPLANSHNSSLPAASLLNNAMSFNSYYHWDPSANLSLSQFGNHGFLPPPQSTENFLNVNTSTNNTSVPPLPSSFSVPSQLFFCPPSTIPASLFPTYPPYGTNYPGPAGDSSDNSRQMMNHFQLFSSNSQHFLPNSAPMMKPFSLNVNIAGLTRTQNDDDADDDDSHADEDNTDS